MLGVLSETREGKEMSHDTVVYDTVVLTLFDSPTAWRGADLKGSEQGVHRLTADEIDDLLDAVARAKALDRPMNDLRRSDVPLLRLGTVIAHWAQQLEDGLGFVMVRGFPVDLVSQEDAALAYWILGLHLGTPVAQNRQGDLLGHVRDDGTDPNQIGVRLYRTRAAQGFHTDGADIIGLLCLKPAKSGGLSRIASSVTVYNEILRRRPDLVPRLFDTYYWDRESEAGPGEPVYFQHPICQIEQGRPKTFYIGWYIRNAQRFADVPRLTPDQTALLDLIEEIANDPSIYLDIDFEPGDIQLLKNAVILHARTAYEDWTAPELKRHLLRLWLKAPNAKPGD